MDKLIYVAAIAAVIAVAWIGAHWADQWERSHGYPLGQMCNSIFTGWIDTCPKR